MSKNINDLREGLFDALDMLKNGELTVEQAKAFSEMSQVVINSAKIDVEYAKAAGGGIVEFLESDRETLSLNAGVVSIRQHRIAG